MTKYWMGVASHDHVRMAMMGGFCQLGMAKRHRCAALAPATPPFTTRRGNECAMEPPSTP
jgi:hypothetical protein